MARSAGPATIAAANSSSTASVSSAVAAVDGMIASVAGGSAGGAGGAGGSPALPIVDESATFGLPPTVPRNSFPRRLWVLAHTPATGLDWSACGRYVVVDDIHTVAAAYACFGGSAAWRSITRSLGTHDFGYDDSTMHIWHPDFVRGVPDAVARVTRRSATAAIAAREDATGRRRRVWSDDFGVGPAACCASYPRCGDPSDDGAVVAGSSYGGGSGSGSGDGGGGFDSDGSDSVPSGSRSASPATRTSASSPSSSLTGVTRDADTAFGSSSSSSSSSSGSASDGGAPAWVASMLSSVSSPSGSLADTDMAESYCSSSAEVDSIPPPAVRRRLSPSPSIPASLSTDSLSSVGGAGGVGGVSEPTVADLMGSDGDVFDVDALTAFIFSDGDVSASGAVSSSSSSGVGGVGAGSFGDFGWVFGDGELSCPPSPATTTSTTTTTTTLASSVGPTADDLLYLSGF